MSPHWLILAGSTAFLESLKDAVSKKNLQTIDEYLVSWSITFFALPFLLPLLLIIPIPPLNLTFWLVLIVSGILNTLALLFYMRAIKISDLSLIVPLVALTPILLIITSPLMVQESPNLKDIIGISLIVLGAYILNFKNRQTSYLEPIRSILKNKGSQLMLIVVLIWSITANLDKVGVKLSSPTFWVIAMVTMMAIFLSPICWYYSQGTIKQIIHQSFSLTLGGFFMATAIFFQMQAIQFTLVAQVIAVKRVSTLLSVFWGYLWFQESDIKSRSTGAIIMILGVFVISQS